jgi:general secretion pathway protein L
MSQPSDVLHRRIEMVDASCLSSRLIAELPGSCGLVRPLRLPAAAVHRLRAVVGLSLGRLSPFRADSVSYDARVAGPATDGQIDVEVGIVPKETLERYEDRLAALGLHVKAFRMHGDGLRFAPVKRSRTSSERLRLLLAAIAVAAWIGALFAIPLSRQAEISSLSADLLSLKPQAERARALNSELTRLQRPLSVASARLAGPDVLDAVRELSIVLPSDIQLSSFDIDDGKVSLSGTGAEPDQVREQLARTAYFRDVTVTQDGGDDGFRVEMNLAKRP